VDRGDGITGTFLRGATGLGLGDGRGGIGGGCSAADSGAISSCEKCTVLRFSKNVASSPSIDTVKRGQANLKLKLDFIFL
jgi:hypothetical protein